VPELRRKSFIQPDETVCLPGIDEAVVELGGFTVARVEQAAGWVWSRDMRPLIGAEVEVAGAAVHGVAVHEASRIMSSAAADQVVVSSVARALADSAGLEFDDLGEHALKALDGSRRLYALRT
jgi:class 3 adenylate cyclase